MKSLSQIFLSVFLVFFGSMVHAQSYEEEIGFTYVKAKYLLETDRFDDAIRELNQVIKENPAMEEALTLRAIAKYELSAFLGTKKDILKSIELKGITPQSASLLAKAEYQLTEFDAALNSLSSAIILNPEDVELLEFRASIFMDRDMKLNACQDWEAAARMGSTRATLAAKRNCGLIMDNQNNQEAASMSDPLYDGYSDDESTMNPAPDYNNPDPILEETPEMQDEPQEYDANPMEGSENTNVERRPDKPMAIPTAHTEENFDSDTTIAAEEEPEIDPRLLDDSPNFIEVDEDLSLEIHGQGLGKREVLRQPNILILSDEDGLVVIDICVSRGGRIVDTAFNPEESTLRRKSLVSLAIRKAKDFWFEKSDLKEQCGQLIFHIKGT